MEDAGPSNSAADFDLMDELISGDYWTANQEQLDLFQPTISVSTPLGFFTAFESGNNSSSHPVLEEIWNQEGVDRENNLDLARRIPDNELRLYELSTDRLVHSMTPSIPLKDRLHLALNYMRLSQREGGDVLIQVWMPTTMGNRQVLTTYGQSFWYDPNCWRLGKYRLVSLEYVFFVHKNSDIAVGLPGRVFQAGVPEWTPDVKYFTITEYLRLKHAQNYNVGGTIALPIFERDGESCVGVVEVVSAAPKINFSSDLENVCNALQAVDLSSRNVPNALCVMERNDSYRAALPEILNVLRAVCETHNLPLAQTWTSCVHQGKQGIRHSEENYRNCVSTVDAACCVNDAAVLGFHQACSEHHLFRGQGVVGEAFTTNQPRFSPDVTSFIREKYPLSHYAKFFHLRAAVAIRLQSIHSGNADFVLEFFLPINCIGNEEQISMLRSLSITMQQVCRSLRVVTAKELEDEDVLQQPNESLQPSACMFYRQKSDGGNLNFLPVIYPTVRSWIEGAMAAPEKEASGMIPSSMEFSKQGIEELSVMTNNWVPREDHRNMFSKLKQLRQDVGKDTRDSRDSLSSEPKFSNTGKVTEKRRGKLEKTVSLQVLRQYFAGNLRDAAKSLGVCPATLQKICRQHGITRWPSRKIKRVGHSLKKLQVVIDSVQGAQRTFQLSSLYENFTKSCVPNKQLSGSNTLSTPRPSRHPESSKALQQVGGRFNFQTSNSNSVSSPSSHSSSSGLDCSSGSKQKSQEVATEENPSQSHTQTGLLKVKAFCGEEKVRFRLQSKWGFQELKQELAKRFTISDLSLVDLKYLDDDSEWVLLTCDADLEECIDVYNSSSVGTIRISVHRVAPPVTRASFGRPVVLS